MCLIAVTESRPLIPLDHLKAAQERNPDGWGMMYPNSEGRVSVMRGMGGHNEMLDAWARIPEGIECAVHFRFATHGPKNETNCHPFKILDHETDGADLYMMHNGPSISPSCKGDENRSDTRQFAEEILTPLLRGAHRKIRTLALQRLITDAIGGDRMVFLEGCGKWHFINLEKGEYHKQTRTWYSNDYGYKERPAPIQYESRSYYGGKYDATTRQFEYFKENEAPFPGWEKNSYGIWTAPARKVISMSAARPTKKEKKAAAKARVTVTEIKPDLLCVADGKPCQINCPSGGECIVATPSTLTATQSNVTSQDWCPGTGRACVHDCPDAVCVSRSVPLPDDVEMRDAGEDKIWQAQELQRLSETELYNLVCDDPEGATDFIGECLPNRWSM